MSLLIKALHQAEQKNASGNGSTAGQALALEPLDEAQGRPAGSAAASAQANNYFSAAAHPPSASLLGSALDPRNWSLVPATLVFAGVVAAAYGYYVYQMTRPPAALSIAPPPAPRPATSIAVPPTPVATPEPAPAAPKLVETPHSTARAASTAEPAPTPTFAAKPQTPPLQSATRRTENGIRVAPSATPSPSQISPLAAMAYRALQEGRLDEAQGLYQRLNVQEPQNTDALLGLAAIAVQKNRAEQASKLYLQVLDLDPRNSTAQAGLIGLLGNADPLAAESRLKQLLATQPSASLYTSLGNLYADQSKWSAAEQAYFDAQRLEPDNANYAFNLAVSLEHLNQPALALNFYRRAQQFAGRGMAQFDKALLAARIAELSGRKQD